MTPHKTRPAGPAQTELAMSLDGPFTLAGLREFLGRCDHAGLPDSAAPVVRVFFGGKIKRIAVRGTPTGTTTARTDG